MLQKALKRIRGGLAVLHGHRIGPLYGYNNAYAGRTRPFVSDNLLQMIPFVQRDPNVKIVQVNYNQFTIAPRNDPRPEVIPDIELLQQKRKLATDYSNALQAAYQIHAEQGHTNEYMNARAAATDLLKLSRQLAKKPKFSLQPSKASIEDVNEGLTAQDIAIDPRPSVDINEHIVKHGSGYRLLSKKTGKNLGDFSTRAAAEKHEREIQYFKHAKESR
jgi:hypothetical protein